MDAVVVELLFKLSKLSFWVDYIPEQDMIKKLLANSSDQGLEERMIYRKIGDALNFFKHVHGELPVTLISRLRLDTQLYDFPPPPQPGRCGPQPQKGRKKRQALKARIEQSKRQGKETTVAWYGGKPKRVRLLSGQCLWHTSGFAPVPIRWVLVVDPTGKSRPEAFFSTDRRLSPEKIVEYYVLRWNVEVTFEEGRRHLGLESQRQWSDKAIARTTPALLGLYSLVCLMTHQLTTPGPLWPRSTAWYEMTQAMFSDILAFVRRAIWTEKYFNKSTFRGDQVIIYRDDWEVVLKQLASTA